MDIDDMLRRTLRYPDGAQVPAVYGPRGAAHLLVQLSTLDMFADTAATHMARDATFVYRTDATDRAETLFDRIVAQIRDKNDDISVVSAAARTASPTPAASRSSPRTPKGRAVRCSTTPTSPRSAPRPSPARTRRLRRST